VEHPKLSTRFLDYGKTTPPEIYASSSLSLSLSITSADRAILRIGRNLIGDTDIAS